jgi:hypothetical protein
MALQISNPILVGPFRPLKVATLLSFPSARWRITGLFIEAGYLKDNKIEISACLGSCQRQ